jgi:CRISPR-associated endonuclease Csn1
MSVFSYDLGKESIGYCVRDGYTVQEMGIDLVDSNHASITDRGLSGRRRAIRTRLAHKMRETWFRWFWTEKLGLADLPAEDNRWSKEFSRDGILYNGASIRVAILRGVKNPNGRALEDWQLFKGVWSLIQRRGYGNVSWSNQEHQENLDPVEALGQQIKELNILLKKEELSQEEKEDIKLLKKDLKETSDSLQDYIDYIGQLEPQYRYPCYVETRLLGLWHEDNPKDEPLAFVLGKQNECHKVRKGGFVAPRAYVKSELKQLLEVLKHLRCDNEQLQLISAEHLAYGSSGIEDVAGGRKKVDKNYDPRLAERIQKWIKCRGSNRPSPFGQKLYITKDNKPFPFEWEGVLSQKVPRFDNRILSKCVLFPSYSVARNKIQEGENWYDVPIHQAKALMFLKNIRFMQEVIGDEQQKHFHTRGLTADELKTTWETFLEKPAQSISATWLNDHLPNIAGACPFDNKDARDRQYQAFKPDTGSGRSRFCRIGAFLLVECLLSGKSPQAYVEGLIKQGGYATHKNVCRFIQAPLQTRKSIKKRAKPNSIERIGIVKVSPVKGQHQGLTVEDLEGFAKRLGGNCEWESISIRDNRDHYMAWTGAWYSPEYRQQAERYIEKYIIGTCMNNVVRNRLQLFFNRFKKQIDAEYRRTNNKPEYIVLEFPRDGENGLVGKKKAAQIQKKQNENEKANNERIKYIQSKKGDNYQPSGKDIQKVQLWEQQKEICLYTGKRIANPLDSTQWEVEHTVPRSGRSSNNRDNLTLACKVFNNQKGDSTPFEYFSTQESAKFAEFFTRVHKCKGFNKRKVDLLLSENARELIDSYNGLADTAYLSRLVQDIVKIYCKEAVDENNRFVYVANGRDTHKMAAFLDAYRGLYENESQIKWRIDYDEFGQETRRYAEKNRDNKKHHAVDASVLSWYRTMLSKEGYINKKAMEVHVPHIKKMLPQELEKIVPYNLKRKKSDMDLGATFYGVRQKLDGTGYLIVQRKPIQRAKIEAILDENLKKELKALPDSAWITKKVGTESISVLKNKDNESDEHGYIVHPTRRSKATHAWIKVDEISQDEWYKRKINKKEGDTDYGKTRLILKSYGEVNKVPTGFNEPQKGLQLKDSKAYTGQFFYTTDNQKTWAIQPVYPHVSLKQTISLLLERKQNVQFYCDDKGNPILFETGCLFYIKKEHPTLTKNTIIPSEDPNKPKVYMLGNISDGKQKEIRWYLNARDAKGKKIRKSSSLQNFIEAGIQRYYPDEVVET